MGQAGDPSTPSRDQRLGRPGTPSVRMISVSLPQATPTEQMLRTNPGLSKPLPLARQPSK